MKTLRLMSLAGIFLGIAMMTIMMIAAPPPAMAEDYFSVSDADWGYDEMGDYAWRNWMGYGGIPGSEDYAYILDNAITVTDERSAYYVYIWPGTEGYYDASLDIQSGGSLYVGSDLYVGSNCEYGTAILTQSGGDLAISSNMYIAGGKYVYSGGSLTVGGSITNNDMGGAYTFIIDGDASGNISASSINVQDFEVGDYSSGAFAQDMDVSISNDLALAVNSDGTYTYQSGTLQANGGITTGSGTSTLNIDGDATGNIETWGNDINVSNFNVGNSSSGFFEQSSMNVIVANDLALAVNADGTYTYYNGYLTIGGDITTGSGTSTFNIEDYASPEITVSGGDITVTNLNVGAGVSWTSLPANINAENMTIGVGALVDNAGCNIVIENDINSEKQGELRFGSGTLSFTNAYLDSFYAEDTLTLPGNIYANYFYVGEDGDVTQPSGVTISLDNDLDVGPHYRYDGGTLSANAITGGGQLHVNSSSPDITASEINVGVISVGDAATTYFSLPASTSASLVLIGSGSAIETNGNGLEVSGDINEGYKEGMLRYTGGSLSFTTAYLETLNIDGDATGNISVGGQIEVSNLNVGTVAGGTYTQNGETIYIDNDLAIGAGSSGMYYYNGGTLEVGGDITGSGDMYINASSPDITVDGGDINIAYLSVGDSTSTAFTLPANVTASYKVNIGSGGEIITNGKNISSATTLGGGGGYGTLTYTGGTITAPSISVGTLNVNESLGLPCETTADSLYINNSATLTLGSGKTIHTSYIDGDNTATLVIDGGTLTSGYWSGIQDISLTYNSGSLSLPSYGTSLDLFEVNGALTVSTGVTSYAVIIGSSGELTVNSSGDPFIVSTDINSYSNQGTLTYQGGTLSFVNAYLTTFNVESNLAAMPGVVFATNANIKNAAELTIGSGEAMCTNSLGGDGTGTLVVDGGYLSVPDSVVNINLTYKGGAMELPNYGIGVKMFDVESNLNISHPVLAESLTIGSGVQLDVGVGYSSFEVVGDINSSDSKQGIFNYLSGNLSFSAAYVDTFNVVCSTLYAPGNINANYFNVSSGEGYTAEFDLDSGKSLTAGNIVVGNVGTGLLKGEGEVTATTLVGANGTIAPGASPGHMVHNGDVTFDSGGTLEIEIGGTEQGVSYDWFDVQSGYLVFQSGSILSIPYYDFTPDSNTSFDVATVQNGYLIYDYGLTLDAWDANFSYELVEDDTILRLWYDKITTLDRIWTGSTGDWNTAENWDLGVPSSGGNAYINNAGTAEITTGSAEAAALYLGQNGGDSGSITLSDGTLAVADAYIGNSGTGTFTQSGGTHSITNDLALAVESGSAGTYTYSGGVLQVSGDITTGSGESALNIDADSVSNITVSGDISVTNFNVGNEASSSGAFTLSDGHALTATNEVVGAYGTGTLTQTGGTHTVGSMTLAQESGSAGTYNLQGGYLSATEIIFGAGASASFSFTGGELHVGTFGSSLLQEGGILSPGSSPGTTLIEGDYTLGASSILKIEIGGLVQGTDYDYLDITGDAYLNGTIEVWFINDFLPSFNDHFDVLHFGGSVTLGKDISELIDFTHASLPRGLLWDWEILETGSGTVRGTATPEPVTILSFIAGIFMLAFRRVFKRK
ncbi:MAG: hypothetical protein JW919_03920 [Candidatus Omnitrophica bacterium]|nr:hypothetical protein [Candidatus Omnitrophota bacterium]